ncbi:hypothetical protein RB195_019210 [Necator americanus]|uniref:Uncharacterized protein n=1 Tax=Necator americanus TaxID=51031 RepID=A0ABR1CE51_NECAM
MLVWQCTTVLYDCSTKRVEQLCLVVHVPEVECPGHTLPEPTPNVENGQNPVKHLESPRAQIYRLRHRFEKWPTPAEIILHKLSPRLNPALTHESIYNGHCELPADLTYYRYY